MAFATSAQRLLLIKGCAQPLEFSVQIEARNGVELELSADDVDHALAMSGDWLRRGARWVEVFRVDPQTGDLIPTIGRVSAVVEAPSEPAAPTEVPRLTIEQGLYYSHTRRLAQLRLSDLIATSDDLSDQCKDHLAELAPEVRLHLYSVIANLTKELLDVT